MNEVTRQAARAREKSPLLEGWGEPEEVTLEALPPGLSELTNPPERAYLWGKLPPPPWVSIVGTRNPTSQGSRDAFLLARRLARAGVTVASGGARGVDSAAHLGALAGRGKTIVIAPTWLPYAYPKNNHRLFDRVLESGGAYLTVAQEGTRPMKFAFFRRNEVLMALSHAVVLGECPLQSGAKNAMQHARKLGRPRFALPFRFGDARALGVCAEVVEHGAELIAEEATLVRFLEEYGEFENSPFNERLLLRPQRPTPAGRVELGAFEISFPSNSASEVAKPRPGRAAASRSSAPQRGVIDASHTVTEKLVLRAVLGGQLTVDAVCTATCLKVEEVQHAVLVLMLSGELVEDDRGLLRFHRAG